MGYVFPYFSIITLFTGSIIYTYVTTYSNQPLIILTSSWRLFVYLQIFNIYFYSSSWPFFKYRCWISIINIFWYSIPKQSTFKSKLSTPNMLFGSRKISYLACLLSKKWGVFICKTSKDLKQQILQILCGLLFLTSFKRYFRWYIEITVQNALFWRQSIWLLRVFPWYIKLKGQMRIRYYILPYFRESYPSQGPDKEPCMQKQWYKFWLIYVHGDKFGEWMI